MSKNNGRAAIFFAFEKPEYFLHKHKLHYFLKHMENSLIV